MNLTPVKVRGKGPRKAGFKQPDPKRQRLNTTDGDVSKAVSAAKRATQGSIHALPKEILESIMLYSKEPRFLYAIAHVWRSLRWDRSFLVTMVLEAFQDTWDLWLGLQKAQVHSYYGWDKDTERFGGDPVYQSKVLALPLMSFELVMETQQRWIVKNGQSLFYQHSGDYNFGEYDRESDIADDELYGINDGVTSHDGVPHRVKGLGHMKSALACFEEEWKLTCFTGFYGEPLGGTEALRLEIHPAVRIPDHLITGPLRKSDIKLFYWLVHSGAVCTEDQTWEMGLRGVQNLFEQDDSEVANIGTLLLYAAGALRDIPVGTMPVSLQQVSKKLLAHRLDPEGCEERNCSWKCVVDRLFDLVGLNDVLLMASHGL